MNNQLLIVANGKFPTNRIPLNILQKSKFIIACDGATNTLDSHGYKPNIIIGDMDSISTSLKDKYQKKIINIENQNENDLRKAINFCKINKFYDINIIGATGMREDHTLANIFSISNLDINFNIKIFTDSGCFIAINKPTLINSFPDQKVSLFSESKKLKITTYGLKYNLSKECITTLFYGALNESIGSSFFIEVNDNSVLLFLKYH